MGFACFACAVAALIALRQWRRRWGRRLALLVAAACLFGCFLTLERGVWIATILATVARGAGDTDRGGAGSSPGVAICAVALIGVFALSPGAFAKRVGQRATYKQSLWDRQNQTAAGLRMVKARPLFGFGLGRYEAESVDYFRQPSDYPMTGYTHGIASACPTRSSRSTTPTSPTRSSWACSVRCSGWPRSAGHRRRDPRSRAGGAAPVEARPAGDRRLLPRRLRGRPPHGAVPDGADAGLGRGGGGGEAPPLPGPALLPAAVARQRRLGPGLSR